MGFQSTPSPKRETIVIFSIPEFLKISIHSLPKEGDQEFFDEYIKLDPISIHSLPKEGDGICAGCYYLHKTFQSTPSPRRETHDCPRKVTSTNISIHSLPKEGDYNDLSSIFVPRISIHSLPKEGDIQRFVKYFCSTYFNPLPPQGGRHGDSTACIYAQSISIHSLPKEGDSKDDVSGVDCEISIHSLPKEGDCNCRRYRYFRSISIHSLPKEGDVMGILFERDFLDFNPLPPQGGRPLDINKNVAFLLFQSTPSPRRETFL